MSGSHSNVRGFHRPPAPGRFDLPLAPADVTVLHHLPQVFLYFQTLHPLLTPAHVARHEGMTGIAVDIGALRAELAFWCRDNLTDEERTILRIAYDCPTPIEQAPPDIYLEGRLSDTPVPAMIRLPIECTADVIEDDCLGRRLGSRGEVA